MNHKIRQEIHLLKTLADHWVGKTKGELNTEMRGAFNSFRFARAWIGKGLSTDSPYVPADKISDIPAETDRHPDQYAPSSDLLVDVNFLRSEADRVMGMIKADWPKESYKSHCYQNAFDHLAGARFYLGFILGRMRDRQDNATEKK